MSGDDIGQYLLGFEQVIVITNAENHIDSSGIAGRKIGNGIGVNFAIGHNNFSIIRRTHNGIKNGNLLHNTQDSRHFHEITDPEWPVQNQHHTCGKIL